MSKKNREPSYWELRKAREQLALYMTAEEVADQLRDVYFAASREIEEEAMKIVRRFQAKHHLTEKQAFEALEKARDPESIQSVLRQLEKDPKNAELVAEYEAPAYASRVRRLQEVQRKVDVAAEHLYSVTKGQTDDVLERIADESYYREIFSLQQQADAAFPFDTLDEETVNRILNQRWEGANYSERIWKNTQALADSVKKEILLNLLTGKSERKMAESIQQEFGVSFNAARRLVRTEACYVANQIQLEVYKRTGVKEYIYSAVLDMRTSEICRGLDGKRFKIKNATVGVNYPPMHPWCRSTTIAAMPESLLDKLKRKAKDAWGRLVRTPAKETFAEWKRKSAEVSQTPTAPADRNKQAVNIVASEGTQTEAKALAANVTKHETTKENLAPLKDITDKWISKTSWEKPDVTDADEFIAENGKLYSLSAGTADNGQHKPYERVAAEIVSKARAEQVKMLPRAKENGVHSPDCSVGGILYEMKQVTGDKSSTIKHRITSAKGQAVRIIMYLDNTTMSDEMIEQSLKRMKNSPDINFIEELVFIRHGEIKEVWGRQ